MTTKPLYVVLARLIDQYRQCEKTGNTEWLDKSEARIKAIVSDFLPSGAGIDSGTELDLDNSAPDKLILTMGYHHMNDGGYYDGWTEHSAIVTPSLGFGFKVHITGRNRNDIKDYLGDVYREALSQEIPEWYPHKEEEEFVMAEVKG